MRCWDSRLQPSALAGVTSSDRTRDALDPVGAVGRARGLGPVAQEMLSGDRLDLGAGPAEEVFGVVCALVKARARVLMARQRARSSSQPVCRQAARVPRRRGTPSIALMARKRSVAPAGASKLCGKFAGRLIKSHSILAAFSANPSVAARTAMTANATAKINLLILPSQGGCARVSRYHMRTTAEPTQACECRYYPRPGRPDKLPAEGNSPVERDCVVDLVGLEPATRLLWAAVRVRPAPQWSIQTSALIGVVAIALRLNERGMFHVSTLSDCCGSSQCDLPGGIGSFSRGRSEGDDDVRLRSALRFI